MEYLLIIFLMIFGPVVSAFVFHRFSGPEPKSFRFLAALLLSPIVGAMIVTLGTDATELLLYGHRGQFGDIESTFRFVIFFLISIVICGILATVHVLKKIKESQTLIDSNRHGNSEQSKD